MELTWSTFLLEVINFLVLVWLLKRFLYRPIQDVIARRRAGIEKSLDEARELRAQAERLQSQYEGRLADWERERQQAREALNRDLETERIRRLQELDATLEQEREKGRVAEQHRLDQTRREYERTALAQGARFASRLLTEAAGPELQDRLIDLTLARIPDSSSTVVLR
jgi:F-type H+-transporting ATPase subunit b